MSNPPAITLSFTDLDTKKRRLEEIRAALKTEFFGIDRCIDAVIESIQTWYLLPEVLTRPPIVGLWGMTGVGKTALVRSLVSHLRFTDRFVEVQMDGFSSSTTTKETTITGLLLTSGIEEGKQGIILLDEFQRFRTVNKDGDDVKLERYPDVWMLLSDGRFPSDYSKLGYLLDWMDMEDYYKDMNLDSEDDERSKREVKGPTEEQKEEEAFDAKWQSKKRYKRRFNVTRSEAKTIKGALRCPDSLKEIMTWDKAKTRKAIEDHLQSKSGAPHDYSKCLVFVGGNLDEAFKMAENVEDCDTSADVFHQHTLKIGVPEIKTALGTRFRPEQIARLGNNHVIYPSLSESAYMSLIKRTCKDYAEQVRKVCDVTFRIDETVYREIYDNSVYPAQGTRPVFTSIHKLFGSPLADGVLWAMEIKQKQIEIGLDIPSSSLVFRANGQEKRLSVDFEIRKRRKGRSADFNALVAVHEAGHALVYAALFKQSPVEVAINVASFKGGYNLYSDVFLCKAETLDRIATSMAGIVAEEAVFGQELRSTGCESDVAKATSMAAKYVRRWAMDGYQGMTAPSMEGLMLADFKATDPAIEILVKDQKARAQTIVTEHRQLLLDLSNELIRVRKMDGAAFVAFIGDRIPGLTLGVERDVSSDYAVRLARAS